MEYWRNTKCFWKTSRKIELLEEGDAWSDSFYKIVGGDNSDYEYITIPLSVEAGGDQDFIDAIKKRDEMKQFLYWSEFLTENFSFLS